MVNNVVGNFAFRSEGKRLCRTRGVNQRDLVGVVPETRTGVVERIEHDGV